MVDKKYKKCNTAKKNENAASDFKTHGIGMTQEQQDFLESEKR